MKEIKSVRVRKNHHSSLDIKVTLNEDGNDVVLSSLDNNNNPVWLTTRFTRKGLFKDFTTDNFIQEYITINQKMESNFANYSIIQDPWTPKIPNYRNYGYDVYYLNNSATIQIIWELDGRSEGGTLYSDDSGKEKNSVPELTQEQYDEKSKFIKTVYIKPPNVVDDTFIYDSNQTFSYKGKYKEYAGYLLDTSIIEQVLADWNRIIPGYKLELCVPNNESCSIIEYKSPLKPIEAEKPVTLFATNETPKEKVTFVAPKDVIKVNIDVDFKVYIGTPKEISDNTSSSDVDDYWGTSDEYTEANFEGMDEQELELQEDVANYEEDSTTNLGQVGAPANIHTVSSLDELLKLAGECARELGKNSRVRYENLRIGWVKGVHGLCPQGTLSVLYALTGIKKIGQLNGNANSFSFNGNGSFSNTGYFSNKVKVDVSYFNNKSSWQVGDVIAVDYTGGKPYGHIQVWTGVKWISDFTQNNLQRKNVDWNSVALWRLNDKGLSAVKKQAGYLV